MNRRNSISHHAKSALRGLVPHKSTATNPFRAFLRKRGRKRRIATTGPRGLPALALSLALGLATGGTAQAQTTITCADVSSVPDLIIYDFTPAPPTGDVFPPFTLDAGDRVTIEARYSGTIEVSIISSPGGVQNGPLPPSLSFTAAADGEYLIEVLYEVDPADISNVASFSASCIPAGTGGGSDPESGTDAEVRTGDAGRLPNGPHDLPDVTGETAAIPGELTQLKLRQAELERELASTRAELERLDKRRKDLLDERGSATTVLPRNEYHLWLSLGLAYANPEGGRWAYSFLPEGRKLLPYFKGITYAVLKDMNVDKVAGAMVTGTGSVSFRPTATGTPQTDAAVEAFVKAYERLTGKTFPEEAMRELNNLIINTRVVVANNISIDAELMKARDEITRLEGKAVVIQEKLDGIKRKLSTSSSKSPDFAITASSQGLTATLNADGTWTRLKLTGLSGTLGRDGMTFNGQFGMVRGTADGGSVGGFVSVYMSNTSSTTLGTSNSASGLGLGAYYKFPVGDDWTGGISAMAERSVNSVNNGSGTGSFMRDLVTLDASVSTRRQAGAWSLVPSATLAFSHSNRRAYTDSTATLIPGRIDNALRAHLAVDGQRVIVVDGARVQALTLTAGAGISVNLGGASTLTFGSGATVSDAAIEGSLKGGVIWQMKSGGIASFGAGISGIGGEVMGFSLSFDYRLRF